MTSLPLDPRNTAANPRLYGNYSYAYLQDVPSKKYSILAHLENQSDPERSGLNPGRGYFYVGTCDPRINYHHYIYEGSPFKQCQP